MSHLLAFPLPDHYFRLPSLFSCETFDNLNFLYVLSHPPPPGPFFLWKKLTGKEGWIIQVAMSFYSSEERNKPTTNQSSSVCIIKSLKMFFLFASFLLLILNSSHVLTQDSQEERIAKGVSKKSLTIFNLHFVKSHEKCEKLANT